jgi:magnesium transporter
MPEQPAAHRTDGPRGAEGLVRLAGRGLSRPVSLVRRTRKRRRLPPAPGTAPDSIVDCAAYRRGYRVGGRLDPDEALQLVREGEGGFVWVGLHEPSEDELGEYADRFGLPSLAVEDAVHAHQRPKLERYGEQMFAVLKTAAYVDQGADSVAGDIVETGEVMVFLGADFVVTVRHGRHGRLTPLRAMLEQRPDLLAHGPASVLYAVADRVVDDYLEVANAVQEDIDEVENAVFSGPRRRADAGRVYQLKREVLEFKRAVVPLVEPLRLLADGRLVHVDHAMQAHFRDVEDHLDRVVEHVEGFDVLLTSILQANLAAVTVQQNEDMRKISSWVAIAAVPTAVAGIYGMNFEHMPELRWTFGYPLVLCFMAVVCTLLYRGFRRNGWL